MGALRARLVTVTPKMGGRVLHGVQDVATGVVYPFSEVEVAEAVAADVNAGGGLPGRFVPMLSPSRYTIEEVAS